MNQEEFEAYSAQSALQRQQIEGQMPSYIPQAYEQMQQHQSILVEQTNPTRILEEVALRLKGMIRKSDGEILQVGTPLMNDKGVDRMIFLLSTVVNQNTILSHLENEEISKLVINLGDDLVDDLALNWRAYDIKDKTLLDYVCDAVIYPAFFALKRALEQNEKNWLGRVSIENISNAPRITPPKKEGFWSKLRL